MTTQAATATTPPPAMPRMSAREDDGPRFIEYAGPESRYHRLRRAAAAESECDAMRPCDGSGRRGDCGQEFCSCPAGDRAEDDFSESHGYPRFRGTKREAAE